MSVVRGEFWIEPDCNSTYADGDIGDEGHEMIAFRSALGVDEERYGEFINPVTLDWDGLAEMYLEEKPLTIDEVKELSESDWRKFGEENDIDQKVIDAYASAPNDREVALGYQELLDADGSRAFIDYLTQSQAADARDWAVEKMGWIRVKGDNYETWEFDDSALDCIQNFDGLNEILEGDENAFEEGGEYEDAEAYIDELSTKKSFTISYRDLLKAKSAAGLKNYKEGIGKWR